MLSNSQTKQDPVVLSVFLQCMRYFAAMHELIMKWVRILLQCRSNKADVSHLR